MGDGGGHRHSFLGQVYIVSITLNLTVRPRWIEEELQLMSCLVFVPCGRIGPSGGPDLTRGPYV